MLRSSSSCYCVLLLPFVLLLFFHPVQSIRCYICNSRRDPRCLDPFNTTAATALDPVSCADVMSTKRFVTYFVKLLSTLGLPIDADDDGAYFGHRKFMNGQESSACQKVEIQDGLETLIVRTCSILSSVACEPLMDQFSRSLQYKFCEVCVTDYCNDCLMAEPNTWMLLLSAVLCMVLLK